jgi:hypothetical protein
MSLEKQRGTLPPAVRRIFLYLFLDKASAVSAVVFEDRQYIHTARELRDIHAVSASNHIYIHTLDHNPAGVGTLEQCTAISSFNGKTEFDPIRPRVRANAQAQAVLLLLKTKTASTA